MSNVFFFLRGKANRA